MFTVSFKPCYKWNTFNTKTQTSRQTWLKLSFKPCYKWNTFNTLIGYMILKWVKIVLNLVISGIPSILKSLGVVGGVAQVLNLVISGIPSIR